MQMFAGALAQSFAADKVRYMVMLSTTSTGAPPAKKKKLGVKRTNLKLVSNTPAAAASSGGAPMASSVAALDPSIKQELMSVFMSGQFQTVLAHPEIQVPGGMMKAGLFSNVTAR